MRFDASSHFLDDDDDEQDHHQQQQDHLLSFLLRQQHWSGRSHLNCECMHSFDCYQSSLVGGVGGGSDWGVGGCYHGGDGEGEGEGCWGVGRLQILPPEDDHSQA